MTNIVGDLRKPGIYTAAAIALISVAGSCQSAVAAEAGSAHGKPAVHKVGKTVHYVKRKQTFYRKPLTRMVGVTRTTELAYAAFVRPHRVGAPALLKVSYSLGDAGPLLGRSPWICSPSGFGQQSSCRSRY